MKQIEIRVKGNLIVGAPLMGKHTVRGTMCGWISGLPRNGICLLSVAERKCIDVVAFLTDRKMLREDEGCALKRMATGISRRELTKVMRETQNAEALRSAILIVVDVLHLPPDGVRLNVIGTRPRFGNGEHIEEAMKGLPDRVLQSIGYVVGRGWVD